MSESNLWTRTRDGLKSYGHLIRVENMLEAGTPDVNYCLHKSDGWVELKHAKKPARDSTVVFKSQRGLDPEQITWIMLRRRAGGRVFVFIQVGDDLLLFDGLIAPQLNTLTFNEMVMAAMWHRHGNMSPQLWKDLSLLLSASNDDLVERARPILSNGAGAG